MIQYQNCLAAERWKGNTIEKSAGKKLSKVYLKTCDIASNKGHNQFHDYF